MNYTSHYERLILRARGRKLGGYRERHHVIPRCMGGNNSTGNLVYLTGEEHYVAHQLLMRMYPTNRLLAHAAVRMATQCSGNKAYGWIRRRHAKAVSERPRSAEEIAKSSAGRTGTKRAPFSVQARLNMSAGQRGKTLPPEHRAKIGRANKGTKHSAEIRERMSVAHRGKSWTAAQRAARER